MTFIEFFDKTCVENICACLSQIPERVIFLGDKKKNSNPTQPVMKNCLRKEDKQLNLFAKV